MAVDLPGNGTDQILAESVSMETYVAFIEEQIAVLGGRVVLVRHSGGGMPATAVAERFPHQVSALVYKAGMCLPQGMDFGQLQEPLQTTEKARKRTDSGPLYWWRG